MNIDLPYNKLERESKSMYLATSLKILLNGMVTLEVYMRPLCIVFNIKQNKPPKLFLYFVRNNSLDIIKSN